MVKGRLVEIIGDCWKLLEIKDYWKSQENTGDYWILLEITGEYWRALLLKAYIFVLSCYDFQASGDG